MVFGMVEMTGRYDFDVVNVSMLRDVALCVVVFCQLWRALFECFVDE